jgi:hypothetical protein
MMIARTTLLLTLMLALGNGVGPRTAIAAAAPPKNCSDEAANLTKDEAELPRLDVASPEDRPPYCITLETLMAFAARIRTHVGRCPASSFAASLSEWDRMRVDYGKLFTQTRCKRTIFN